MASTSNDLAPKSDCMCPECGHRFRGSGFDGIDAHWRAKHEAIMPYSEAWPLIKSGSYAEGRRHGGIEMKRGDRVRVKKLAKFEIELRGKTGTVIADSTPGHVVLVGMDDEPATEARQLLEEDLENI